MFPVIIAGGLIVAAGLLISGDDDDKKNDVKKKSAAASLAKDQFNVKEVDEKYVREHLKMGGRSIDEL